ncbi:MAG: SOS response-associated peptidase [Pseudomonadota bacterium]
MCGRFAQYSDIATLQKTFQIQDVTCNVTPGYNIAPLQKVLSIIHHNGNRLGLLRWGLVPAWAQDIAIASKLINARLETLETKPSFRNAFKRRRCLIPADGFYEWKATGRHKQPWYFTLRSGGTFAFAGLWETWKGVKDAAYHSCTIITTTADDAMRKIHHRMPVILTADVHTAWLNPENQDPGQLKAVLAAGQVSGLKQFPISQHVNSTRNNDPACIKPLEVS